MVKKPRRAALYARVSTDDGRQTTENQLRELRQYARLQGWRIAGVFCDQITGASARRPELDQLLDQLSRREFDTVLVWDLSRLTRGGPAAAFTLLRQIKETGAEFESFREPHFRTSGPAGELLIAIAAWIAEEERRTMQARIIAGQKRARKAGIAIGRPRRLIPVGKELEREKIATRATVDELAAKYKTSRATIERRLQEGRKK